MSTFIPFGSGKVKEENWIGHIEISPPLNFREATYLANYLTTWHFSYPEKELDGLYGVHSDKEIELSGITKDGSYLVKKVKQDNVPSLISPLILGSNNWDKKNVINAIGMKTHIKGLRYTGSWVMFLIEHFFKKDAYAKHLFYDSFGKFQEHVCNGSMLYMDSTRGNSCVEINVVNNIVSQRGVKKKYIGKINDGFSNIDYPIFLKHSEDRSALTEMKKLGVLDAFPSEKSLKDQDKVMKMKDIQKNLQYDNAKYMVFAPEITITEKLKIEYEQYYMENNIPAAQDESLGPLAKF